MSPPAAADYVEIMRFDPEAGILDLERHLARLRDRLTAGGHAFNRHDARNELHAATFRLTGDSRVLIRVSPAGATAIEVREWRAADALPDRTGTL